MGPDPTERDAVALVAGGASWTRSQLRAATARLADAFSADGLTKARVGLDLSPSFGAVAAYLALLSIGNTVVVARRIDQPPWPGYLASAALDAVIRPQGSELHGEAFGDRFAYDVRTDGGAGADGPGLPSPVSSDRPAVNLFTSGTTGRPKIVEISHQAWIDSTGAILEVLPLGPTTRTALVLSLAHSFGLSVLHTHLRARASLYCVERPEFQGDVLRAFTTGGCNALAGVPTQLRAFTAVARRQRHPHLPVELVMQAGGRLEVGDAAQLLAGLSPDCRLYQMFGQTEAAARISILDAGDRRRVPSSVGRPIRGLTVRIVDDTGHPVPPGQDGEIIVRGSTLMSGYYADPEATNEVLRDGWLYTGDFGYLDDEGFLYVTGRRSTFVKIDGERISLEAVEYAALAAAPEAVDALASPVPGDGELAVGLALVLAAPLDAEKWTALRRRLSAQIRGSLGKKAVPVEIVTVPEIAYTANGKKVRARVVYPAGNVDGQGRSPD